MSDREAEFREFVAARMEPLRGLAYLTCGDWQVAEDAVLSAPATGGAGAALPGGAQRAAPAGRSRPWSRSPPRSASPRWLAISGTISETEARKVLDSVTGYTPDDQSTWLPVEEAVPERYLLRIG